MLEAFADMERGGFDYNNFMLQRWVDHNDEEHRVIDDFERGLTALQQENVSVQAVEEGVKLIHDKLCQA